MTTFEVCKAPYFCQEHVLQVPGLRTMSKPNEFIAEENLHLSKELRQKEVRMDDDRVRTSNYTPSDDSITSKEERGYSSRATHLSSLPSEGRRGGHPTHCH
jgi:hypothetical protein